MKKIVLGIFAILTLVQVFAFANNEKSINNDAPVIIFMGPPGVGKGTQASAVSKKIALPHISTGDLIRDLEKNTTDNNPRIQKYREMRLAGKLIPDDFILELLLKRLSAADCEKGFILDGYPRNVKQIQDLKNALVEGYAITILNLEISDDVIVNRLEKRRVCSSCHAIYHLESKPPKVSNTCDQCGSALKQRQDDNAVTILERLKRYRKKENAMVTYLEENGENLIFIDAVGTSEVILERILSALEK